MTSTYTCVPKGFTRGGYNSYYSQSLEFLPLELRPSLSDVKLTLRCYKVKEVYESLADVAFVMGRSFSALSSHHLKGETL